MGSASDPNLPTKQDLLDAEKTADHLNQYFQDQKPEWTVTHRWQGVFDSQVFYFTKGKEKRTLQVTRQVLTDLPLENIIERLRSENWEQALEGSSSHFWYLSPKDFIFRLVTHTGVNPAK